MQVIINILIMIVMLGVLISLHEAGHLAMAKAFGVYCFEYSIGFGPKIIKTKKKGAETYFSIRAIPLGGYVSMYGEEGVAPEGESLPDPSRSLQNKKTYQKIIIMIAGVVINYILGILCIFLACFCFKTYYVGYGVSLDNGIKEDSTTTIIYNSTSIDDGSTFQSEFDEVKTPGTSVGDYYLYLGGVYSDENISRCYILDGDVDLSFTDWAKPKKYVALYSPSELTKAHSLTDGILLFPATSQNGEYVKIEDKVLDLFGGAYVPEVDSEASNYLHLSDDLATGAYSFQLDLTFLPHGADDDLKADGAFEKSYQNRVSLSLACANQKSSWPALNGLSIDSLSNKGDASENWEDFAYYVPWANKAIFQGLASLFTPSGIQNASGIIGMTAAIGTVMANGGARSLFLYAGLISINLAIFNLLPFPGLDGWQICVSLFEGISHKKIDPKVKGIAQLIGLGLLFVLAIVIAVKDIVGLF